MFGIGGGELALIIIVLLLFVGPDKLPQVVKTVGEGLRDLRRAANIAQHELKTGMDELTREMDGVTRDVRQAVERAAADAEPDASPPRSQAAKEGEIILAEVRRRQAEERVRDESPPAWALKKLPGEDGQDLPSPPKPSFRVPGSEPLVGTVARPAVSPPSPRLVAQPAQESSPDLPPALPKVALASGAVATDRSETPET